jgi:hypothetical protein
MSEQSVKLLPQEQPAPGSREALYQAVNVARQATQAAQAVGAPDISFKEYPPLSYFSNGTESIGSGAIHGWDAPAIGVQYSLGGATKITAKTSFVDRERGQIVNYELYDYHNPLVEKSLELHPHDPEAWKKLGHTQPVPVRPIGKISRTAGNGEILSERKIYRPETARRLATTIANQVTRRAETAHSAKLAPRQAPRRSQFSHMTG